jgi:hypothetical protein
MQLNSQLETLYRGRTPVGLGGVISAHARDTRLAGPLLGDSDCTPSLISSEMGSRPGSRLLGGMAVSGERGKPRAKVEREIGYPVIRVFGGVLKDKPEI